ncbi:MAG: hypothetical protein H7249_20520 [Chitinophagaceae bacterium]|nr:hypothetical protein [Oligoflexus sp.]
MKHGEPPSKRSLHVSVPGKILLAGEYAILRGGRTLSATVETRLKLEIAPASDFAIYSDLWSAPLSPSSTSRDEPLLDSVQFAARQHQVTKAHIHVQSDLDVKAGLGSSSAVRLAAHLALAAFAKQTVNLSDDERWDAARAAWRLQKAQQGFASGYDLVTQMQGGFVEWTADYERWPGVVRSLSMDWLNKWVHPYVGGAGAPTKKVGGSVRSWLDEHHMWPDLTLKTEHLIEAILSQNAETILNTIRAHRTLFASAPFYPQALDKSLAQLSGFDRSWTFKTTGAGGEDAILLIGPRSLLAEPDQALKNRGWSRLKSSWSTQGSLVSWKDFGL